MNKIRHIVLLKFRDDCSSDNIREVEDAYIKMQASIETVRSFEWGINNSPENLNDGYTHCFVLTFHSEEDRQIFLPHPAHSEFINVLRKHMEKGIVFDYTV